MIHLCEKELCTGCLACFHACPKNAITIEKNNLGFKYPEVNDKKCINCGTCSQVCHVQAPNTKSSPQQVYSYKGKKEDRLKSSSGALFPLLADYFLENDYYICGVIFSDDFLSAKYVITKSKRIIEKMRKSKYVEADLENTYEEVKILLDKGEKVVFFGMPCHISGLLKYTKSNPNLITVDLFCFGAAVHGFICE